MKYNQFHDYKLKELGHFVKCKLTFFCLKSVVKYLWPLQYFFKIESKGNLLAVVNYRPGKSITKGLTINEKGEEWFEIAS